uniref:Uncharacterized protein n=1 Tax=Tanacetum cinerariifolium TaxID=118510 RepID=A0A699KI56_TANCI|nr:hypothetical protein [Tanacetum cinerariifolium]
MTEAHFEDERTTTTITNPNDLNIAVPDQVLKESTFHTSDKVEVMPKIVIATYEEHMCQDGLKPVTITSAAGKKGVGCGVSFLTPKPPCFQGVVLKSTPNSGIRYSSLNFTLKVREENVERCPLSTTSSVGVTGPEISESSPPLLPKAKEKASPKVVGLDLNSSRCNSSLSLEI